MIGGYPYLRKSPFEGCDTGSMLLPEAADLHSVLSAIEAFADGRKWLKALGNHWITGVSTWYMV